MTFVPIWTPEGEIEVPEDMLASSAPAHRHSKEMFATAADLLSAISSALAVIDTNPKAAKHILTGAVADVHSYFSE
jgi:hypothetical protein